MQEEIKTIKDASDYIQNCLKLEKTERLVPKQICNELMRLISIDEYEKLCEYKEFKEITDIASDLTWDNRPVLDWYKLKELAKQLKARVESA